MRNRYLMLFCFFLPNLLLAQTTYFVNGPVNGQGPLLGNEDTGTNTGWTEIHSYNSGLGASDNSWSAAQTLPFAFEFFGTPVTQFCVSKNYLLTFDASVASTTLPAGVTTDNTALPNAGLPDNSIAYFWGGFGDPAPLGTNDDVWIKTYGTPPNRQLWIKNFSFEGEAQAYSYNILVLEETTNKIYVIDTRWETAAVGTYTVGLQKDAVTAVSHPSSPAISSINGNITAWNAANIYYYEFTPFIPSANDASLISIDSPGSPICTALSPVTVTMGSNGASDLTSATINWSVNGILQTPFAWTGTIPQFGTQSGIVLGNYTFTDGDVLSVWTSAPNGSSDGDLSNDTLDMTVNFGVSGTYTVGWGGDYFAFADVISHLSQDGVCGHATFNVLDGTYPEQITIPEIMGADDANTVTFQSLSGDSTAVVLTYAGTGTTDNFVVRFDGGDYFTFKNMTIHNSSLTGYSRVLEVGGNSTNNTIQNCILSGDTVSTSTSTNLALIYSTSTSPSTDSHWLFDNNRIIGGSHGVYWYGESSTPYQETGTVFSNNEFESNYYRGARLYYQQGATFVNNRASYHSGYGTGLDVFYLAYCDSGVVVTDNYVYLDSIYGDGLTLYYCETSPSKPSLVANNQVIVNAPNTSSLFYATYIGYSDYVDFFHNSVFINNTSTTARSFYSIGGIENHVVNNAFVNEGAGYGLYYSGSSVTVSDHNDIYTPVGTFGYFGSAIPSLGSWQLVTGMDINSLNVNPVFSALNDLHTCEAALDAKGMPGLPVTTDVDGEARNTVIPDIGADEFYAPGNLTLGADTSKCIGQPVSLGGYDASPGTYLWSTGSTASSIDVTLPGTYHVTISGSCGLAQDTILITDIPLPVADFSHMQSFLTAIVTDESTGATSWLWDFGDGGTSTLQNPVYVYDLPGTYTITLTVTNDCGSDVITSDFTASIVGMDEYAEGKISIFPNPAHDQLNISFTGWESGNLNVEVLDMSGKTVSSIWFGGQQEQFIQTIPVEHLESGIYLIRLIGENGSAAIFRFEKQ